MNPFTIKDCSLASIATGVKAQMLNDFRDKLAVIDPGSIHFHFWNSRLRTSFEHHEYLNDFAYWVHKFLNDDYLSERLALINPSDFPDIESLRNELIEIIDERLDEIEFIPWAKYENQFHFITSKIIVFDTHYIIKEPQDLQWVIPHLSKASLFYHFIDARRRTEGASDDFSTWLKDLNHQYEELIGEFKKIDPYLVSLSDLKTKLLTIVNQFFSKESHG